MKRILIFLFIIPITGCTSEKVEPVKTDYKAQFVGKWGNYKRLLIFGKDSIAYEGRVTNEFNRIEDKTEYFFTPKVNMTYRVTKDTIFLNTWNRMRTKIVRRTAVSYKFNEMQTTLYFNNSHDGASFFDKPVTFR